MNQSSGSLRLAAPRLACLLTVLGFLSACGGTEPEPSLVYSLAQPLPAPTDAARWPDGTLRVIEVLEGRLTLSADGSFKYELRSRRTVDGVPVEDLGWAEVSGVYERTDSTLIAQVHIQGPFGRVPSTLIYDVSDSGRVLRGAQGFGRVYEWVLVDSDQAPLEGR